MTDKILSAVLLPKDKKTKMLDKELDSKGWLDYIYKCFIDNNINIKEKESIIHAAKCLKRAMINRDAIITNASIKIPLVVEILNHFKKKSIVFTKSKAISLSLEQKLNSIKIKSKIYNSDVSDNHKKLILEAFTYNMIDCIICINELKEGLDIPEIDLIIRHSFNGTQTDAQQILGRAIRLDENNPNKYSLLINFYVKDFTYRSVKYKSPDIHKLEYAYKGLPINWVESISDIKSATDRAEEI
jgi:superfamily II DNA or RNA helicase